MAARKARARDCTWGDLKPARVMAWDEQEDGAAILVPRFGRGKLGKKLESFFRARPYKVRLDPIGTFVWKHCDGTKTVEQIAEAMREHFGQSVEPVEDRLIVFLRQLLRGRFVVVDEDAAAS